MPSLPWFYYAALIIGAVVRALKSDGASALLTRVAVLFGRDEKAAPVAIPTRALPFVAFAFGLASAFFDARVEGATWSVAAQQGLWAAALAVFGHELGSGIPGVKKVLSVALVFLIGANVVACTPGARSALAEAAADLALCGLANMNLTNDQLLLKCGAKSLEDRDRLLRIVGEARAASAHEASVAAERARDEAERAAAAGKVGACGEAKRP